MSKSLQFPLPARGIDWLSEETSLVQGGVREAVNVDIGRNGTVARRRGYTNVLPMAGAHSLFYAKQRGIVLFVAGAKLFWYDNTSNTATEVFTLSSNAPVVYCEYNGNVYFTNRTTTGWLPADSKMFRRLGVPVLSPQPRATYSASGGLQPGTYAVVVTCVDDRGEEGGGTDVQFVNLSSVGGILLDGLPIMVGQSIRVYVTTTDGEALRKVADFPAVFPSYIISETPAGQLCDTQFFVPLPPGDHICWHNGRLVTAADGAVRFSQPLRPHLHDPAHDILPMSGHISLILSTSEGLYIGDSRGIWFMSGRDPDGAKMQLVTATRAAPGTGVMVPPESFDPRVVQSQNPVPVWLSTAGYAAGLPNGEVVELQADRVVFPVGNTGKTAFMTRDGKKQLVTVLRKTAPTSVQTAIDSEV